ncbi:MAG: BatA domain-containing protein [Planctomycetes bacterium]|nr:BatA domain-containing protein [Planctomycetota bacterium]
MLYSLFSTPVLLSLLGLAAVPVLIHLINMMRHRRVKWAAMDFLLVSYKKHRNWVWLKQLLLLLMRVAAILFVVMMLAGVGCRDDQFASLFGGRTTHHYVLLDDSFSMSERVGGAFAFDRALQVVKSVALQSREAEGRQRFTLIRFSRAAASADEETAAPLAAKSEENANPKIEESAKVAGGNEAARVADVHAEYIDTEFDARLEEITRTFEPSQLAVGPAPALSLVRQLLDDAGDENRIVYVVSDFRANEWSNPAEPKKHLQALADTKAEVHLVTCVNQDQPNLAITDLSPANETRAAGVPLFVNVSVKNFGRSTAHNVQVKMRSIFFDDPAGAAPGEAPRQVTDLPPVLIEEIAPGDTAVGRMQVYFPKSGRHAVEAELPADPVAVDNLRYAVIDFPAAERILLVDGDPERRNEFYLTSVFQPGSRANTGVVVDSQSAPFLNNIATELLEEYKAVFLCDVPRLDAPAIENLETYVKNGGGVAIYAGPNVNLQAYNGTMHRDGEGFFPVPLEKVGYLVAPLEQAEPDMQVEDHPVFAPLLGERNPLLRLVNVHQYLQAPAAWRPDPASGARIVARLRDHFPLVVEKSFGKGRVMAILTTAAPMWNNWAVGPSFVVVNLKLQSHLAASGRENISYPVGTELPVILAADRYRREVSFVAPGADPEIPVVFVKPAAAEKENDPLITASLGGSSLSQFHETARAGVYEAWPLTSEGTPDVRRFAVNVAPEEGRLERLGTREILAELEPLTPQVRDWQEHDVGTLDFLGLGGFRWSRYLFYVLVGLLLGEQLMAYATSYHPPRGNGG